MSRIDSIGRVEQAAARGLLDEMIERIVNDVFDHLVEQAAGGGLLDSTYRIDSTHVEAIPWNDDASWSYDSTAEEHYYDFGCTIVSTGAKVPIAAEFTPAKQALEETASASHVTRSPSMYRSG